MKTVNSISGGKTSAYIAVHYPERFFNNSDPTNFKIPVSCSILGQRQQKHETFNWRNCSFPLIKHAITKQIVDDYWQSSGFIEATLFSDCTKVEFPLISNCVGCFHKKPETLCIMAVMNPEKMNWFARQEDKDMGTWLDSKIKYETLIRHSSNDWIPEMIQEFSVSCDSGGCTD